MSRPYWIILPDTSLLVQLSKIVEFRNIESLRCLTATSEKSILSLKDTVSRIQEENHLSATISMQNHKDGMSVKAVATISMIFLPASLLAVSMATTGIRCMELIDDRLSLAPI
jgi:hypothetical protein